jgi:hypothetical protein
MSFESGAAPRRLLQTHGAFINAVLTPNLKQKRQWGDQTKPPIEISADPNNGVTQNDATRLNRAMGFVANDEVFDAREGEILVNSVTEGGFPSHRRGSLYSSLNGFRSQVIGVKDPRKALHQSDLRYVGLCQNAFVSSNQALSQQGMAVQVSGIKTIINDSEETINIGDKLMVDTMQKVPSKVRKGIPNEKVRLVLRKVPQGFVPDTAIKAAVKRISDAQSKAGYSDDKYGAPLTKADGTPDGDATKAVIENIAAVVLAEFRRAGNWVVGVAENSARHGEQLDVLLTKPSFL